jgi:hypothetical protein
MAKPADSFRLHPITHQGSFIPPNNPHLNMSSIRAPSHTATAATVPSGTEPSDTAASDTATSISPPPPSHVRTGDDNTASQYPAEAGMRDQQQPQQETQTGDSEARGCIGRCGGRCKGLCCHEVTQVMGGAVLLGVMGVGIYELEKTIEGKQKKG